MLNIAVVDDQPIIRQGIVELIHLNNSFKVVLQASNGLEAYEQLSNNHVELDLMITDIQMPKLNGIELIKKLRNDNIDLPILVLTTFSDNELLVNAIKAGCNGFLLKDISVEKLNGAIVTVANGNYLLEPQTINQSELTASLPTDDLVEKITDTEKQILRFAAAGFSNKEISSCMHLAEGTVKNYISRILEKTHSRDRTQAVVKAMSWNVI